MTANYTIQLLQEGNEKTALGNWTEYTEKAEEYIWNFRT